MNKAEFREYLKNEAFNFVNRRYDEWNRENPNNKWTVEQMAVVEKFAIGHGPSLVGGDLVNNIIDGMGNMVITVQVIKFQKNRLLYFLGRIFDEHQNNPQETVSVIGRTGPRAIGGKKSKKYRKTRKSRKSRRRR